MIPSGVEATGKGSLATSQSSQSQTEYESSDYNETDSELGLDIFDHDWKELLHLKRVKNADQPCVTLPPEILFEIFNRCRPPWNPDSRLEYDLCHTSKPYSWQIITHICHRWRDVALCSSALWNEIHFHASSRFPVLMIERSRDTALHVRVCDQWRSGQAQARISSLLKANLHRIRTMNFTCRDDDDILLFKFIMPGNPAPLLETIFADFRSHEMNCRLPFTGSLDQIMPAAPNLATLVIQSTMLDVSWQGLPSSLTKLIIEADRIRSAKTTFMESVLLMLERVPSLQDLELVRCDSTGGDYSSCPAMVTLSSLRRLQLSMSNAHRLAQFLSRLSIPPTATMKLETEYTALNTELASIIRTRIVLQSTAPAAQFNFGFGEFATESVRIRLWEENHDAPWVPFEHYREKSARLDITLCEVPMGSQSRSLDILWRFLSSLPIDSVVYAGFTNLQPRGREPLLLSFLSSMPNVRAVDIDGPYRETLALVEEPLDFDVGSQSSSDPINPLHPQSITSPSKIFPHLERIAFDLSSSNGRWLAYQERANNFVRDLRRLLQVRQDAGSGVKEVWFYGIGGIDLDMFCVVRADGFEDIKRLTTCNFRDVFTDRLQEWPEEDEPVKVCGLLL